MADAGKNAARSPHFEPLTFGAILDRTISLYIRNFVLFFGIMLIPQALNYANGIVLGKSLAWGNRLATVLYILACIVIYLLRFAAGTGAAKGARWRILGIFLLYMIVIAIASYGSMLLVNLTMGIGPRLLFNAKQTYIHYLVGAPLQFLFAPIPAILVLLIYYNQRIRKEGYDLVLLAEALAETRDSDYNRRGSQE